MGERSFFLATGHRPLATLYHLLISTPLPSHEQYGDRCELHKKAVARTADVFFDRCGSDHADDQ